MEKYTSILSTYFPSFKLQNGQNTKRLYTQSALAKNPIYRHLKFLLLRSGMTLRAARATNEKTEMAGIRYVHQPHNC